jgi:excisionase family DNA binding protein
VAAVHPPSATYRADNHGTYHGGVTIDQAAVSLGVSPSTVRRWVKSGRIKSERVVRPQGYVVLVDLPERAPSTPSAEHPLQVGAQLPTAAGAGVERADAMATYLASYAAKVVEPHLATIRQQAEEIGRLKAELEHIRRQPAETATEPTTGSKAVSEPATRPWWRRWFGP